MIQSTMNNISENLIPRDPTLYPYLLNKEENCSIKKCFIPCIFIFIILLISLSLTIISYKNDNSLSE